MSWKKAHRAYKKQKRAEKKYRRKPTRKNAERLRSTDIDFDKAQERLRDEGKLYRGRR